MMMPAYVDRKEESQTVGRKTTCQRRLLLLIVSLAMTTGVILAAMGPGRSILAAKEQRPVPEASAQKNSGALVGVNFRISQIAAIDLERDASAPDIAYNAEDNEYLVVWHGNGLKGAEARGVSEIFGHRVNAATGALVGADFRISNMSDGGKDRAASEPRAVYNSTSHEYLVVWQGEGSPDSPDSMFEIYGQRLSRTGAEVEKDFRISTTTDLGKIQSVFMRASAHADVAWNSKDNQYLVVWDAMGQPDEIIRTEIFGQLLDKTGGSLGKNFRISNTNDQGAEFNANLPAIAYSSASNQYLVVWAGPSKNKTQNEIWAQGVTAQGEPVGKGNGDFLISQVSTNIGADRDASAPQVAYNSTSNEFLVVFQANGLPGPDNDKTTEVFGQRINGATLAEVGPNDFRISNTPGEMVNGMMNGADNPRVAFNASGKEYLVIWRGIRITVPFEIFGQRLGMDGSEIEADFQVSNVLAVGKDRSVNAPALASNGGGGEYLAVWKSDALPGPSGKGVNEIFGQRIKARSGAVAKNP